MRPTVQQYYDLLLLGMMWLSEGRSKGGELQPRSLPPILQVLRESLVITPDQQQAALTNPQLRKKLEENLKTLRPTRSHTVSEVVASAAESSLRHLVLFVPHQEKFLPYRLLQGGTKSYRLILTRSGNQYAKTRERQYADVITGQNFLTGWDAMRRRADTTGHIRRINRRRQERDSEA